MSYRKTLPLALLALLLALPGSKYLWFDGLPLSSMPERLSLVLVAYVVVSNVCRDTIRRVLSQNWVHRSGTTILLVVLVAKLWSYFAFPLGGGFETCLRSLYAPTESCEQSYEGMFLTRDGVNALGSISRIDSTINFGPLDRSRPDTDQDTAGSNWNLPFTNDFPRFSELWLDRLPFRADIGTRIHADTETYLPITLVGDLEVRYSRGSRGDQGTDVYNYSSYDSEQRHDVPIPQGDGVLRLVFQFKEGAVGPIPDTPPSAKGPYATLVLYDFADTSGAAVSDLLRPSPRDVPNIAQGLALNALNVIVAAIILGSLIWFISLRRLVIASLLVAASTTVTLFIDRAIGVSSSIGVVVVVTTILAAFVGVTRGRLLHRWSAALSIAIGSGAVMIASTAQRVSGLTGSVPWNHLLFRGRDSDWLVYQGYARQIFLEQSLRGGEATYYFVPGMRYIAFTQHVLLGDSDLIIALSVLALLLASTLLLIQKRFLNLSSLVPLVVAGALLATWIRPLVLELVTNGAAEPIAWLFLLAGMLPWLGSRQTTVAECYTSIALLASSVFIRPNLLFAVSVLVVWILVQRSPYQEGGVSRVRAVLLCLIIFSLAFFHNLHYGESSTPFTTFVSLDRDLTLPEILRSPFDADLRPVVLDKIRFALSWSWGQGNLGVNVTAWAMQIVWLSALIGSLRRRATNWKLVVLASPVVYLLSLLPFRYTNIPTRHFVAMLVLMGVSALIAQRRPRAESITASRTR